MTTARKKRREPAKITQEDKSPTKRHQSGSSIDKADEEMKEKDPVTVINLNPQESEGDSDSTPTNGNGDAQVRTPRKRNETGNRSHNVRVDVKILVPADDAADKRLTSVIKAVLHQLKSNHVDLLVKPWKSDSPLPCIWNIDRIPVANGELREYADRAFPSTAGGVKYISLFLGLNEPIEGIIQNSLWWFKEKKMAIYKRDLQVEKTARTNWLLYSTPGLDTMALKEAIHNEIGVEISLRYGMIAGSLKYDKDRGTDIKGYLVETDLNDSRKVKTALRILYGAKATVFPLGIKLRYVPMLQDITHNVKAQSGYFRLRLRQAHFVKKIVKCQCWEVASLDFVDSDLKQSLRSMIMSTRSVTHPSLSLFHSVDTAWRGGGVIFQVIPQLEQEAREFMAGKIITLRCAYGDKVDSFFTPEAIERAQDMYYDETDKTVKTKDDDLMDELEQADGDFTFAEDLNDLSIEPKQRPSTTNLGRSLYGNTEEDSVGTLATVGHTIVGSPVSRKSQRPSTPDTPNTDSGTVTSGITVETRIDNMEGQLSSIHQMLAQLTNQSSTYTPERPEQASASGTKAADSSGIGRHR